MTEQEIINLIWQDKWNERASYISSFNSMLVNDEASIDPLSLDGYAVSNYWHLTSSKFKCFVKSPLEYYLKYELLLPNPFEKAWDHFALGTAFDKLRTLISDLWLEEWTNKFMEDYYIEIKLLKKDYFDKLIELGKKKEDIKSLWVDELKELFYEWQQHKNKIKYNTRNDLTFMIRETEKNKEALDLYWGFDNQKFFSAEYYWDQWQYDKPIVIAWTLDRYKLWTIRDWKTSSRLQRIITYCMSNKKDIEQQLELLMDDYWYWYQAWFYCMQAYINDEVFPEYYLDFISTVPPFNSFVMYVSKHKIENVIVHKIIPWLNKFLKAYNENIREEWDISNSPYYIYLNTPKEYEVFNLEDRELSLEKEDILSIIDEAD